MRTKQRKRHARKKEIHAITNDHIMLEEIAPTQKELLTSSKVKPPLHALEFTYLRQTGLKPEVPSEGSHPRIRLCKAHLAKTASRDNATSSTSAAMYGHPSMRKAAEMLEWLSTRPFKERRKRNPKRLLAPASWTLGHMLKMPDGAAASLQPA